MSKISKALDKYKKEHNRSSTQIFHLDDAKPKAQAMKEGEAQFVRDYATADAANKPTQPQSQKTGKDTAPTTEIFGNTAKQPEERSMEPAAVYEPERNHRVAFADRRVENLKSEAIRSIERKPVRKVEVTASPEPDRSGINIDKIDPNLISVVDARSLETEIFKVLRAKILFPTAGKPPRAIMITSAVPGEGKSFVAANLAVNMAQNIEDHVLLMDCDLRRPTIHRLFGLGRVEGLSEYFQNGTQIPDLLIKTGLGKLSILPSGMPPHNPSEILSSAKMAQLLDEIITRYQDRYLIIESPPPMLAPETTAIAKQVDGIIVVIKFGSTPLDTIEELIDNLGKERIIGAVVNRFDAHSSSRYYGYRKYGSYYRK
jgi:exopolysaccharide/PEP-CTERM locus tyrosine autokinase